MLTSLSETYLLKMKGSVRGGLLLVLVVWLSWLFNDSEPWDWELANRNNVINIYMVKWGWGWTFFSVGAFLMTCSYMRHGQHFSTQFLTDLLPIFIGTAVWYVFVEIVFPYVEDQTGVCKSTVHTDKRSCRKAGFWWTGFDSSGHCFLLIWNILFIVEETSKYIQFKEYRALLNQERKGSQAYTLQKDINKIAGRIDRLMPVLKVQLIVLSLLTFIWELMLLSTVIHFHSTGEKIVGTFCALSSWFVVYRLFKRNPGKFVLGVTERSN